MKKYFKSHHDLDLRFQAFFLKNSFFQITIYLLLFALPTQCLADHPKIWFQNDKNFLLKKDIITNGTIHLDTGFFGGYDLQDLVSDHPQALELANLHTQYNTYAKISFWAGSVPFCILSLSGLFINIYSKDKYYQSGLFIGSLAGLLGTSLLTSHFLSLSRHYLLESINTYNGVPQQQQLGYRNDKNTFFASVPIFTF